MIHLVGQTQNGIPVYADLVESEGAKHISRQPHLLTLAAEALRRTKLSQAAVNMEYDMGRVIGYDFVVKTTRTDTIFYARLLRDKAYTRFTKKGRPLPTNHISLVLRRDPADNVYHLQNIWMGRSIPALPGSTGEVPESRAYWEEHAVVFDSQPIQARTLTKTCPY